MRLLHGHTAMVMAVAFSPDGRTLASASWDGSIRLWNLAGGDCVSLRTGNDRALAVAWSPDGKHLAASFRMERPARLARGYGNSAWFPSHSTSRKEPLQIRPQDTWNAHARNTGRAVCFSPDGKRLATSGLDIELGASIKIWDASAHQLEAALATAENMIVDFRFCPDGKELAAISNNPGNGLIAWDLNKSVRDWETERPHFKRTFRSDRGSALTYSPDGMTVIGAFVSGRLVWWQPGENAVGMVRQAHNGAVNSVACSPDGRTVLSAGADGLVKIWDARTRKLIRTFDWQIGDIVCVAVSPDGLTAAAGGNGVIVLWDLEG